MTDVFVQHCITVYEALDDRATLKHNPETDTEEKVFVGAVVQVYKSLGISQTYYSPIFRTLEDVGAILRMQKGARGQDTVIVLRGLPDEWPVGLGWKGSRSEPLTEDSRYGRLLEVTQELQEGSINGINVILALTEIETRVGALESKIQKMEAASGKAKK
jgi:hypothetical protein